MLEKIKLGTLKGGAQDNAELAIARDIHEIEQEIGQKIDIRCYVERASARHRLVPASQVAAFARNIGHAYDYVTNQKPIELSRSGYWSLQTTGTPSLRETLSASAA